MTCIYRKGYLLLLYCLHDSTGYYYTGMRVIAANKEHKYNERIDLPVHDKREPKETMLV